MISIKHIRVLSLITFLSAFAFTVFAANFNDDHNDNVITGWTKVGNRSWSEISGKVSPASGSNNVGLLVNNNSCSNDGTLEAVITADKWNGQYGGVLVRYASSTSYVFICVCPADQFSSYIKFCNNSTNPNDGVTIANNFSISTTFRLKVEITGSTYKVYLNNVPKGLFTNTSHPSGKVGYGYFSQWNSYISFDNITWTDAVLPNYTLSTTTTGSGTVTPASGSYPAGSSFALTASPAAGYRFVSWSGDLTGTDNPASVIMNSNKAIVANFAPVQYTLGVTTSGSGTVTPASGTYDNGTVVTLTATPAAGYVFDHWSGNLTGTTNPASVTMNANKAIVANFVTAPQFNLTATVTGRGFVSPASGIFTSGTTVSLTATPATGYRFDHWSGDLTGATNPASVTMNADKAIVANFVPLQYTLDVTTTGSGTVTPGSGIYDGWTEMTLTATPAAGYVFDHWSGDLTGTDNPASFTMIGNKAIVANFVPAAIYSLQTTVAPGPISGTITPASGSYAAGSIVTVTAIPAAGFKFDHWGGDLTGYQNPISITFTSNKSIIGYFVPATANKDKITITSKLYDDNGNPLGTQASIDVEAKVRLYDHSTAGNLLYTEQFLSADSRQIKVQDGDFLVRLGEGTTTDDLKAVIAANPEIWVEIEVDGQIFERIPLTSSAYLITNP